MRPSFWPSLLTAKFETQRQLNFRALSQRTIFVIETCSFSYVHLVVESIARFYTWSTKMQMRRVHLDPSHLSYHYLPHEGNILVIIVEITISLRLASWGFFEYCMALNKAMQFPKIAPSHVGISITRHFPLQQFRRR